ncbi:MAG: DUF192 domain-containing protein [Ignavibacteria bacterium]|nr:MAG: DUF192 domain-containing protein [Ignavibacteria bacterium]
MAQKKRRKTSPAKETKSKNKFKLNASKVVTIIVLIAVAVFFIVNNFITNNEPEVKYYNFKKEGELTFTDSLGTTKIKIDLEIADNEYERQLGLMNRKSMEENQGMLFIFQYERMQSFWMRNTLIPLDMMFVNKDNKIITIHKNTKTLSAQSYPSTGPAKYVVEVIGGFTDKYKIEVGDKIFWMGIKL